MRGQAGYWDLDERYQRLSTSGDPLEKLNAIIAWDVFDKPLVKALKRSDGAKGGRPPYVPVLMFSASRCPSGQDFGAAGAVFFVG